MTSLKILARPAFANRKTNPFNAELYGAMQSHGASVSEYRPWKVFFKKYHIVHVHWPESSFKHNLLGALLVTETLLLALRIAKFRGARIVWTVHNLMAHDQKFPYWETRMWSRFLPLVDVLHGLTESSIKAIKEKRPQIQHKESIVVPHGHYRNAYPTGPGKIKAREQLAIDASQKVFLFIGQIHGYKNVPHLIQVFKESIQDHPNDWSLIIAGKPRDAQLLAAVQTAAQGDERITTHLKFINDNDLGKFINAADLVVLPYKEILNSGTALLALSFNTPVLMPAKGASSDLKARVGEVWVQEFSGDLTVKALESALENTRDVCGIAPIDNLDWKVLAQEMLVGLFPRLFTKV